ncbi:unnamed protein product [Mytilus edulis]|uniref:Reverse transcriptase domain-containing protein n=1 Tax=Mytilus edulis TaxID=6550 RepID=A0A8S3V8W7_MYTED|nr:unnamed protein product [Mytilus edulis]
MLLFTLNIRNGFENKIYEILDDNRNIDIICLQETGYMSPDVIQDIKQKFNKNVDFSNGVSRSTGVITIVNKDLKLFKSHRVPTPLKGRLIHNSYVYNDTVINLLNLYAPQCGLREEQRLFYDILLNYVSNVEQYSSKNKYILTGDFNFIEDKIDSNNMNCRLNKYILDKFKSIKDTLKIKDVYREIHKDKANFTCYNISGSRTRIDRFYADNEFINKISEIKHIPYKKSDHKMVQINIQYKRQKWGRGFWKMNNSLLENEKYTVLISNIIKQWKEDKLKYDPLKGWDLLKKQIKETTINFSRVQAKISKSKLNKLYDSLLAEEAKPSQNCSIINTIKDEIIAIETKEKIGTLIRSRECFYKEDIKNIEIFKIAEEKRGTKKEIKSLLDKNNKATDDKNSILQIILDFYSELYTSDGFNDQKVDEYLGKIELNELKEEDWSVLNQFISKEECLNNIKDFENNKSPGIDGLGKEFYLKFWNVIGDEVVEIVNNIYLKGELTETMKMGIITLNYKNKGDKKDLKQWRPISLLCFDYKLITKTLAKRLSKVINKLVDIKQTGAGEEKNIFDNIISISDIFDHMNLNDIKGFLINFDQEKAFDKIKHEFLIKVLKKMNLPVEFVRWIKILYKDIKSKIQVNGQLTEEILITRSVRQGCPLSMNLYALAIETLASSIRRNKNIKGINIPNLKDPIKLFQHADDCTTITTDIKDYYLFMNEFEKFGKASGAKINKKQNRNIKYL